MIGEEVTVRRENVLDDALRTIRRGSFPVDHTIILRKYFTLVTIIDCVCYCNRWSFLGRQAKMGVV